MTRTTTPYPLSSRNSPAAHITAGVLLAVALIVLALGAFKVARVWPHAAALWSRARELRALAGSDPAGLVHPQRLAWAREQLGATRDDLQAMRAEIRFLLPVIERLDWIPRFGGDIAAAPALLDLGIELCDAGWWGLLGLEPVWDALSRADSPAGQTALEAALPPLMAAGPRFAAAAGAVDRADLALERLRQHELSPRLAGYVARLGAYWPVVQGAPLLAQDLPALLGQSRPVSYLILAQNNHELRPTGGFISGAGLIQLSAGKIISTTFQDSYAVDALCGLAAHPPAPQPLREYMWAPALVFRDANWSPDLPSSAATASSIYRLCRGLDVDGVVAMDLDAVGALLGALGPLQPEGYPNPVTAGSLLQYVGEYWTNPLRSVDIADEAKDEWWLHRKDFMADLLKAALLKVTAAPQSLELAPLGMAVLRSLQGRHLLVALSDPVPGRGLAAAGWDGALRDISGDYLMVVDANVGFRKVNPQVQQSVDYRVALGGAKAPRAALTVRYANRSQGSGECVAGSRLDDSYAAMMQGCYWDYVRVYAPAGSRLLAMHGGDAQPQVAVEAGKSVFSTLLVVAPGQTRELVFEYELPSLATNAENVYSLWVQKQAGTDAVPYRVTLAAPGWTFSPSRSGPVQRYSQQEVTFSLEGDAPLAWVNAGDAGRAATVAILVLAGLGLLLIGLGLWVRGRSDS